MCVFVCVCSVLSMPRIPLLISWFSLSLVSLSSFRFLRRHWNHGRRLQLQRRASAIALPGTCHTARLGVPCPGRSNKYPGQQYREGSTAGCGQGFSGSHNYNDCRELSSLIAFVAVSFSVFGEGFCDFRKQNFIYIYALSILTHKKHLDQLVISKEKWYLLIFIQPSPQFLIWYFSSFLYPLPKGYSFSIFPIHSFPILLRICNLFLYLQHRLSTILDYERIIVLEQGRIVEDGNPRQLQQDASSLFHALLHKAGQSS